MGQRIFYGWYIVFATAISLAISSGVILLYTFGFFIDPLAESLGVSRKEIGYVFSLMMFSNIIVIPIFGHLVDRMGVMIMLRGSCLAFGIGLFSLAFVQSLWQLGAVFIIVNAIGMGTSPLTYTRVLTNWFDKKRGVAIGFALCGIGIGAAILPPITQFLISGFGWRSAFAVLGLLAIMLALPLSIFVIRASPSELGLGVDGTLIPARQAKQSSATEPNIFGLSLREALRGRQFWLLAFAFFAGGAALPAMLIHLVPMLTDGGKSAEDAAKIAAIVGISVLLGRILAGYLLDKIFAPFVVFVFWVLPFIGTILFVSQDSIFLLYLAAVCLGLGLGAESDFLAFFVGRYFGVRSYGQIYALIFMLFTVGIGVGPSAVSYFHGIYHNYDFVPILYGVAMLPAGMAILALGPYWEATTRNSVN